MKTQFHIYACYIPSLVSWGVASCAYQPSYPGGRSGRLNHDSFHTWKFLKIHKIEQDTSTYLICACFQMNQNKASLVNFVLRILLHKTHGYSSLVRVQGKFLGKVILLSRQNFPWTATYWNAKFRRTGLIYCVPKKQNHICPYEVVKW